ncbi:hypothetical protein Tco_0372862 [Tanacetum coccineum]
MKMTTIMIVTQVMKVVIKRVTVVMTIPNLTKNMGQILSMKLMRMKQVFNLIKRRMKKRLKMMKRKRMTRLNKPVNTDEGFIQKEGTDAKMINVEQGNENLEITLS